ncbi:MAG: helix-turn-helix domain-containing protein [Eubacteriales bacterium]|nr:helix-turn-helix domain-containing protein [Eubacteriales bacterium]
MNTNDQKSLEENLIKLGFGALEAKIYLALLSGGSMSAYQLAKKIDIARPSIYNALEHMVDKGMVACTPDRTPSYAAAKPELLLEKIEQNMRESLETASLSLKEFEKTRRNEEVAVIKGYDNIIIQVKDILKNASHDIYINTDFDLDIFAEEFAALEKKGLKVIVFSFYDVETGSRNAVLYSHGRNKAKNPFSSRLMLAEYDTISITAGRNSRFDDWSAVLSTIPLHVRMIEEHIHNDIYMLRLRNQYGAQIYNAIRIGTAFEAENRMQKGDAPI